MTSDTRFDAFLSYSSEDREAVILPFLSAAEKRGIVAWCDIHEITWGDSIVEKIHEGMRDATFIIVFISRSYLKKPWPLKELQASLAKQLIGGPPVLPVLIGVEADKLAHQMPFLSDIKHISLPSYNPTAPVPEWFVGELVEALNHKRELSMPFHVASGDQVASLSESVCAASFGTHYAYFSIVSLAEAVEVGLDRLQPEEDEIPSRVHYVEMQPLVIKFFEEQGILDIPEIACSWVDNAQSPCVYFALKSGNLLTPHRATLHNDSAPYLKLDAYNKTGAPESPICMTAAGRTNQVVLGYEDGSLFVCGKTGRLSATHRAPITCIDASSESIMVTGQADGRITIWSRADWVPLCKVESGARVLNIAVCRYGSAVFATSHSDGHVQLWSFQGEKLRTFAAEGAAGLPLAFFPEGYECLAVGVGANVWIWDYQSGKRVHTLQGDGQQIVTMHVGVGFERFWRQHSDILFMRITAGYDDGRVVSWPVRK